MTPKDGQTWEDISEIIERSAARATAQRFRAYCDDRSMRTLENPSRMEADVRSEDKVIRAIRDYHQAEAFLERSRNVVVAAEERAGEAAREAARQIKNFAGRGVPVWWDGYQYQATETSDCRLALEIAKCRMRVIREGTQSESRVDLRAKADHSAGD